MPRKEIRLMPEYDCFPLWDDLAPDNLDPSSLPISPSLNDRIQAWNRQFAATQCRDDPDESGFPTREEEIRFDEAGRVLWDELRAELGDDYVVRYRFVGNWSETRMDPPPREPLRELVLTFSWWIHEHGQTAICSSNAWSETGGDPLATVFLDYGGLAPAVVEDFETCIQKLEAIIGCELTSYDWIRELWGATFQRDCVKAYSLLDETHQQELGVDAREMQRLLKAWLRFIQSPPSSNEFEISCRLRTPGPSKLKFPHSDMDFIVTPVFFLGAFDVYDREETLGLELSQFDPNVERSRAELLRRYIVENPQYSRLTAEHRTEMLSVLKTALDEEFDFDGMLASLTLVGDFSLPWKIVSPRTLFEDLYRLAVTRWPEAD